MTYKIEKKVAPPKQRFGKPATYPFRDMRVGDSFEFPKRKRMSARRAAYLFGQRNWGKFMARGNRIWRVR